MFDGSDGKRLDREGTHLLGLHVPAALRAALRVLAAENGTTISGEVLEGLYLRFQALGRPVPESLDALLEELRLHGRRKNRK